MHHLAGSGGTFGYAALSDVARALESALAPLQHLKQLTPTNRQLVSRLIADLFVVAKAGSPDGGEVSSDFAPPLIGMPPPGQTVYIAEDDPSLGSEMEEQLLRYGYDVAVFRDAMSAEEALSTETPAAMIVDLNLSEGELAGAKLARAYRSSLPDKKPLIFISARDDWSARLAAARAGGRSISPNPSTLVSCSTVWTRSVCGGMRRPIK